MTKIINALLFRLSKSILFWIMLGVVALLPLATAGLNNVILSIVASGGVMVEVNALTFMAEAVSPYGDAALVTIIVMSVFLGKEFSKGTMRNILLSAKSRGQMFFSFVIVAAVIAFSYSITSLLSSLLFSGIMFGFANMPAATVATHVFYLLAMSVLATLTVISISILFIFGTRKMTLIIIMPLLVCFVIPPFIIGLVGGLEVINQITGAGTVAMGFVSWLPIVQYYLLNDAALDGTLALKILLMSTIVVGACGWGGYFAFSKADLK